LHEELKAFHRIAVEETCVIIITKITWIGQMIVTHIAGIARVDANRVRYFVLPLQYSVGRSKVVDGCNSMVPATLLDSSSAQAVLDAPVR